MPALRKAMEQREAAEARTAQMKKTPKKKNSGSLDQHKHDDYNINESQDSGSNGEANPDEIEDLNIG